MTHEEQRKWLIQELLEEDPYYKNYKIPEDEQEQKDMLRSLMNVRMPKPISKEFQAIEDAYLIEENEKKALQTLQNFSQQHLMNGYISGRETLLN